MNSTERKYVLTVQTKTGLRTLLIKLSLESLRRGYKVFQVKKKKDFSRIVVKKYRTKEIEFPSKSQAQVLNKKKKVREISTPTKKNTNGNHAEISDF